MRCFFSSCLRLPAFPRAALSNCIPASDPASSALAESAGFFAGPFWPVGSPSNCKRREEKAFLVKLLILLRLLPGWLSCPFGNYLPTEEQPKSPIDPLCEDPVQLASIFRSASLALAESARFSAGLPCFELFLGEFPHPEFVSASFFPRFWAGSEWSDLLLPELFLPRFEAVPEHPGKLSNWQPASDLLPQPWPSQRDFRLVYPKESSEPKRQWLE